MSKLDFSFDLTSQPDELMKLSEDYAKLPKYLPDQLKSVKIIEKNGNVTKTEQIISFSTIVKKKIIQQSLHKKIGEDKLNTEIISGPAKGTIINYNFKKKDSDKKVIFEIEKKLELKAKILQPLIKKYYKAVLRGVLYRMNNDLPQVDTVN